MSITEKGELRFGVEVDGVRHKDFELRLPTMADTEEAIEEAGEGACVARVNRHVWARTLTRLGTCPPEKITPALLGTLVDTEYGLLSAAEESLRGKLAAASASSAS
ncbi:MAG: hypothetical protein KKF77_04685 [Proteobacteria bacterium]|nr:hypothetical protein [Pseudomonadota bacterium]